MELDNLIVLRYTPYNYHVEVLDIGKVEKLKINLEKGTWSWRHIKNVPIGIRTYIDLKNHQGVIGVYNKTKTEELNNMVYNAVEAMKDY